MEDRFRIYLTCYQVLDASGDSRAREFLANAYYVLQTQASAIEDETIRDSFLTNVPSNRSLVAAFKAMAVG